MKDSLPIFAALALTAAAVQSAPAEKPNVVVILVDDLRWDALGCMNHPFLKTPNIDRIAKEGMIFRKAFTTISLCGPSRAGFLTGTYPQRNGVERNEQHRDPDPALPNLGQLMQRAGYETAFIGKWHMALSAEPRPGFDHWISFEGQGVYIDPKLNEDGRDFVKQGYITDILNDYAIDWINRPRDKPFLLYLSHKAVHMPFTPAERHKNLYADAQMPEPPYWQDTLAGKPEWQRAAWIWGNSRKDWTKHNGRPVPDMLPPSPWKPHPTGMRLKYYQYFMENWVPGIPGVQCVRTEKWKYMRYPDIKAHTALYKTLDDMDELYDLQKDPNELHNLAENPEYKPQRQQMQTELERLLKEAK